MQPASASGGAGGTLSVNGEPTQAPATAPDPEEPGDQFSAVINIHDCNLAQIEAAIAGNAHSLDPHPSQPGRSVRRHPVYLVAVDYSHVDDEGRPAQGKPLELDLTTIRGIFSSRPDYSFIADGDPPADGSHIRVAGMHNVAELDQSGNPTGRVTLGSA